MTRLNQKTTISALSHKRKNATETDLHIGHFIFSSVQQMVATAYFHWFRWCYICKEHPIICNGEDEERRRRLLYSDLAEPENNFSFKTKLGTVSLSPT